MTVESQSLSKKLH